MTLLLPSNVSCSNDHNTADQSAYQADLNRSPIGLCERRRWPDPLYEPSHNRNGYYCKVRVNNREYATDVPYKTEVLARDGAATKAFMICRNFSANDGMFPGQRPGSTQGVVQGLPVAIGAGRRSNRSSTGSENYSGMSESETGTSSGGNSPKSFDSGFEQQLREVAVTAQMPRPVGAQQYQQRRAAGRGNLASVAPSTMTGGPDEYVCLCRRGAVRAYGRCEWCLRESGWA